MAVTFLKPDKIITTDNGLTIKQKIIPDSLLAPKDVASWIKKGQKMKPCAKLNNGTGKPKAVTVHNTGDIKVASGTNAAEQYTRATYNGNMSGVVVHFYVWDTEIWQNLREDERGWHAADGSTRRSSQRKDGSTIGGNLDTIAIECIEKQIKAGHFEISAAVSRMGGNPDVDELMMASDQIRCAAEFVKACSEMELSYREDADGNPA